MNTNKIMVLQTILVTNLLSSGVPNKPCLTTHARLGRPRINPPQVPIGFYQLSNNPERVASFCADRPSSCTDTQRTTLLTMSYFVGVVGIITFFLLMTLLMRMVFILIVALERANLQARPENIHPWVRASPLSVLRDAKRCSRISSSLFLRHSCSFYFFFKWLVVA